MQVRITAAYFCAASLLPLFARSAAARALASSSSSPSWKPRFRIESGAIRLLRVRARLSSAYHPRATDEHFPPPTGALLHVPLHPTLQIPFAQFPALLGIDAALAAQAAQVLFHEGLAFGVVVEREGASFGRNGFADDLAAAGAAEGAHVWVEGDMGVPGEGGRGVLSWGDVEDGVGTKRLARKRRLDG